MHILTAFLSGFLFGLGILISGMGNPKKVLAFLDLAGHWDPSLIFVMISAISISFFAFRFAKKRGKAFNGQALHFPSTQQIDWKLITGSLIFGAGWGLAGICPGPAITLLINSSIKGIAFILAMLLGMGAFFYLDRYLNKKTNT